MVRPDPRNHSQPAAPKGACDGAVAPNPTPHPGRGAARGRGVDVRGRRRLDHVQEHQPHRSSSFRKRSSRTGSRSAADRSGCCRARRSASSRRTPAMRKFEVFDGRNTDKPLFSRQPQLPRRLAVVLDTSDGKTLTISPPPVGSAPAVKPSRCPRSSDPAVAPDSTCRLQWGGFRCPPPRCHLHDTQRLPRVRSADARPVLRARAALPAGDDHLHGPGHVRQRQGRPDEGHRPRRHRLLPRHHLLPTRLRAVRDPDRVDGRQVRARGRRSCGSSCGGARSWPSPGRPGAVPCEPSGASSGSSCSC